MDTLKDIYNFFPELNKEDDIGEQLNRLYYSKIVAGKSIYIWGRGNTAKGLLQEISNLNVKAFIDNNIKEEYIWYNGKKVPVIAPVDLEEGVYTIVASVYYEEICCQLEEMGKIEYIDFISYRYLLPTPKSMFATIIEAPKVTNWKCVEAMRTKRLQADGGCCFCACPAWTNQSAANIFLDRNDPIEENIKARLFFYSIISGKYTYCKKGDCPGLMQNWNNFQSGNEQWEELKKEGGRIAKVIMPDFDRTCNLHCKKCRAQVIHESGEVFDYLTNYFIEEWMPYSNLTKLAGNGEVMASKYYKRILEHTNSQEGVVIYSNGTLLRKPVVSRLANATKGNCFFIISLDAVKKSTYCELQGGGDFDSLMENLREIGEMTKMGKVKGFRLAFVVSRQNEDEMDDFVDLGKELGAEAISFLPLKNLGTYSSEEYEELSLFTEDNEPKTKEIKNKILRLQDSKDIEVFFCDPDGTVLAYKALGFE